MKRRLRLIAVGYALAIAVATPLALGQAGRDATPAGAARFLAVDIYVDPLGKPLAAYQFELREAGGRMLVVGLENGEHAAFGNPPLYDRAAIGAGRADRVIAASYSLLPPDQLPTTRTRVATIHMQIVGESRPDFELTLIAAGDANARPIPATLELQ